MPIAFCDYLCHSCQLLLLHSAFCIFHRESHPRARSIGSEQAIWATIQPLFDGGDPWKCFTAKYFFLQLSRCGPLMSMTQECHREILIQDHPTSTSTTITTTAISKTTSTTGSWARLPTSKEGLKELRKTRARLDWYLRCQGIWIFYFYSGFCL